jgi:hypothetical protein
MQGLQFTSDGIPAKRATESRPPEDAQCPRLQKHKKYFHGSGDRNHDVKRSRILGILFGKTVVNGYFRRTRSLLSPFTSSRPGLILMTLIRRLSLAVCAAATLAACSGTAPTSPDAARLSTVIQADTTKTTVTPTGTTAPPNNGGDGDGGTTIGSGTK